MPIYPAIPQYAQPQPNLTGRAITGPAAQPQQQMDPMMQIMMSNLLAGTENERSRRHSEALQRQQQEFLAQQSAGEHRFQAGQQESQQKFLSEMENTRASHQEAYAQLVKRLNIELINDQNIINQQNKYNDMVAQIVNSGAAAQLEATNIPQNLVLAKWNANGSAAQLAATRLAQADVAGKTNDQMLTDIADLQSSLRQTLSQLEQIDGSPTAQGQGQGPAGLAKMNAQALIGHLTRGYSGSSERTSEGAPVAGLVKMGRALAAMTLNAALEAQSLLGTGTQGSSAPVSAGDRIVLAMRDSGLIGKGNDPAFAKGISLMFRAANGDAQAQKDFNVQSVAPIQSGGIGPFATYQAVQTLERMRGLFVDALSKTPAAETPPALVEFARANPQVAQEYATALTKAVNVGAASVSYHNMLQAKSLFTETQTLLAPDPQTGGINYSGMKSLLGRVVKENPMMLKRAKSALEATGQFSPTTLGAAVDQIQQQADADQSPVLDAINTLNNMARSYGEAAETADPLIQETQIKNMQKARNASAIAMTMIGHGKPIQEVISYLDQADTGETLARQLPDILGKSQQKYGVQGKEPSEVYQQGIRGLGQNSQGMPSFSEFTPRGATPQNQPQRPQGQPQQPATQPQPQPQQAQPGQAQPPTPGVPMGQLYMMPLNQQSSGPMTTANALVGPGGY